MKKILLIEDERMLAKMYQEKFSEAGFEVVLFYDSEGALELVKNEKPDLIVLDILLPRENGITFLQRLKNDPETSLVSVVAFSNYDDPKTKEEAIRLGAVDYLIKTDFTPQELIERIKIYIK